MRRLHEPPGLFDLVQSGISLRRNYQEEGTDLLLPESSLLPVPSSSPLEFYVQEQPLLLLTRTEKWWTTSLLLNLQGLPSAVSKLLSLHSWLISCISQVSLFVSLWLFHIWPPWFLNFFWLHQMLTHKPFHKGQPLVEEELRDLLIIPSPFLFENHCLNQTILITVVLKYFYAFAHAVSSAYNTWYLLCPNLMSFRAQHVCHKACSTSLLPTPTSTLAPQGFLLSLSSHRTCVSPMELSTFYHGLIICVHIPSLTVLWAPWGQEPCSIIFNSSTRPNIIACTRFHA